MTTNLYLDMNPFTHKPFYVGIGTNQRCRWKPRKNIFHKKLLETFPHQEFDRIILYKNISLEIAHKIEKQIIKRCGKLIDGSGILANIHDGGPLESKSEFGHPYRGRKMRDIYGDDWTHPHKGKPYLYMYDAQEKELVIQLQKIRKEKTRQERIRMFGKSKKERNAGNLRKERIKVEGFTEAEKSAHSKVTKRQQGLSMRERLNNPNWTHPHKGKSRPEGYIHPRLGKKLKTTKGSDYVEPKSKPFKLAINDKDYIFSSESDFIEKTKLSSPILCKIKKNGTHTIKRQSNSLHQFNTGDTIQYLPLTLEEYKTQIG